MLLKEIHWVVHLHDKFEICLLEKLHAQLRIVLTVLAVGLALEYSSGRSTSRLQRSTNKTML